MRLPLGDLRSDLWTLNVDRLAASAAVDSKGDAIMVIRAPGLDGAALVAGLERAISRVNSGVTWSAARVGGKLVELGSPPRPVYLYGFEDFAFEVITPDSTLAAEALGDLP